MKLNPLFYLIAMLAMCGCRRNDEQLTPQTISITRHKETPRDRHEREAREEVDHFLSNNVVGLTRVVSKNVHFWPKHGAPINLDEPTNWWGEAVAEYINKAGGIERTNIEFHFRLETDPPQPVTGPYVVLDYEQWAATESQKWADDLRAKLEGGGKDK